MTMFNEARVEIVVDLDPRGFSFAGPHLEPDSVSVLQDQNVTNLRLNLSSEEGQDCSTCSSSSVSSSSP